MKYTIYKNIYILLLLLSFFVFSPVHATEYNKLLSNIQNIINNFNAEIGVAVRMDGKEIISINDSIKYPLQSVFKFHQAIAVCNELEKRKISLNDKIELKKSDLAPNTWSPLRDNFPEGKNSITFKELIKYILEYSDNNASDILFAKIIDPASTDAFIRSFGIDNFAIVRNEKEMHDNLNYCYDNWTTPSAAAKLVEIFLNRKIISHDHQKFIKDTMIKCETGKNRIPSGISDKNVIIGHKTGTGDTNDKGEIIAINDIGFVNLPNGGNYIIAIFVKDSNETFSQSESIIKDISKAVYDYMTSK